MKCTKCDKEITGDVSHVYYPLAQLREVVDEDGNTCQTLQGTLNLCPDCATQFKDEYNAK